MGWLFVMSALGQGGSWALNSGLAPSHLQPADTTWSLHCLPSLFWSTWHSFSSLAVSQSWEGVFSLLQAGSGEKVSIPALTLTRGGGWQRVERDTTLRMGTLGVELALLLVSGVTSGHFSESGYTCFHRTVGRVK